MLAWLLQENLLEQALEDTAEQFSDLLYDLISVRKMEHHAAWELAIEQTLLPEESTSASSPKKGPHVISASPRATE